jgi:hypothetical protein
MSPPSDSDWGRLQDADSSHEQQIAQLAIAFSHHRDDIEKRFAEGAARMRRIESALDENTKLTESVADIVQHFESIGRGIAWTARRIKPAAIWITSVAAAVAAVYHLIVDIKWLK